MGAEGPVIRRDLVDLRREVEELRARERRTRAALQRIELVSGPSSGAIHVTTRLEVIHDVARHALEQLDATTPRRGA